MLRRKTGCNSIVNFVPTQEAWVIERMGKFHKILDPGVNFLVPFFDNISYIQTLKEQAVEIPEQEAITMDNVILDLDAVLYLRITDPYKASYGVECPIYAVTQLAQTTMRSEHLNITIVEQMNAAAEAWGLVCMRYEIRTITMPKEIQKAMMMQVEAERKKRAAIFESEGIRQSAMNVAEGQRHPEFSNLREQINQASGVAKAIELEADARKKALDEVSSALQTDGGREAANLLVAQQYVKAFENLAKSTNSMIVPANANDVNSMVSQAMMLYKQINQNGSLPSIINEKSSMASPVFFYKFGMKSC
uniref:Band 7 domain-containing protein n=1 Tax=Ditylenchus dipsaci TaxID=166011 RepID=A0A915D5G6_9BILA